MASKVIPALQTIEGGETIQFTADGATLWTIDPSTGAGVIDAASGAYAAPPLILTAQTATVTAKGANDILLGKAFLQLKTQELEVVPAASKLRAGGYLQFVVKPAAYGKEAVWTLEPASPGRLSEQGVYTAPDLVATRQEALVIVRCQNLYASAKISLVPEECARNWLVAYWVLAISGLVGALFSLWPGISSTTAGSRLARVTPPLVTLKPGDSQVFQAWFGEITNQAQGAVLWQASRAGLSSNGLNAVYVAPTNEHSAMITAVSVRDPQLNAHAWANISTRASLTLLPEISALSPGETAQFIPVLDGANASPASFNWRLSPGGSGTLGANGLYTAPETAGAGRVATVTVVWTNDPGVAAAGLVRLGSPPPSGSASLLLQLGLVLILGAVGSLIHAISSFVIYVGNRQFVPSWSLWYVFKPFQGAALALVVYLVAAVGLLKVESVGGLFGAAALAAMVGLFSEEASAKLRDVATTLFGSSGDKRADKLDPNRTQDSAPHITGVTPPSVVHGTNPSPVLTITGANFAAGCMVRVNGADRAPASASPTELKLNLTAADIASAGKLVLLVVSSSKQVSNEAQIPIT